ncbi:MAG TPA: AIM24 family protein [Stellaceae bacterium]|nr:AIM24 family protein [Stellaceae bacterium]
MQTKIDGTTLPVLQIGLEPGEVIVAEPAELGWMSDNIALNTTTQAAGAKGLWGILGRAISGGGLFMTEYRAEGGPGFVAFAAKLPGTILPVEVPAGHSYMIHRHGFLCATQGAQLSIGFQRSLGSGLFGGDGFILQKLEGPCSAFVELGGESVVYDLPAGQSIKVHPGHIGMFQDTVDFDIVLMRGITNALFGGDGLFLARLTGPGKVWLQSLTVPGFAHALAPYIKGESGNSAASAGVAGGVAGAVGTQLFNDIFGRKS